MENRIKLILVRGLLLVVVLWAFVLVCPVCAQELSGETPLGEVSSGEKPSEETPSGETSSGETPLGETSSGETPSEETPSEETPSEETPSEEIPPEETPSEETPSEEETESETEESGPIFLPIFVDTGPKQEYVLQPESSGIGEADVASIVSGLERLVEVSELLVGIAFLVLVVVSVVAGYVLCSLAVKFFRGCGHG